MMDKNNDRSLTAKEFKQMLLWLGLPFSHEEIQTLSMLVDKNNNGTIEYYEILDRIRISSMQPATIPALNLSNV